MARRSGNDATAMKDGEVGVLGGKRAERTTAWVLVALGMLAAAAGGLFNLYNRFHWYDEVIHAYNFFALALLAAVYAYGVLLTGAREHDFLLVLFGPLGSARCGKSPSSSTTTSS